MQAKDGGTLQLNFDRFWVDLGASSLRPSLEGGGDAPQSSSTTPLDGFVGALGRAAFLPQFAVFPVLYVDDQLAVFQFPPLKSNIAVRKVAG